MPVSRRPKKENESAPFVLRPFSTENPGEAFAP